MSGEKIIKSFAKYVSQSMIAAVGLSLYIIVDTFFVSLGLGTNGLAALNLAIVIYSVVFAAGQLLGIGGGTRYTILRAQGRGKEAETVFAQSLTLGLALGIVLTLAGLFLSPSIARLLGAGDATFEMTREYLQCVLFFAPVFIINSILVAFVRNDGNPRLAMGAMLCGTAVNIVLDYIFIFPLGMGMFGAAFASCLSPVTSIGVLSIHFIKTGRRLRFLRPGGRAALAICAPGLSVFVTEIAAGVVLFVFNHLILGIEGVTGVAAYGVIANLAIVVTALYNGIAQGIQPILSKFYGEGQSRGIALVLRYALVLSGIVFVVVYGILCVMPDTLVALFNSEREETLAQMARTGLFLYFSGFLFSGFNIVAAAYFSAVGQSSRGFAISLIRGGIALVPFAYLLSSMLGMHGVWLSFPAAEVVALLVAVAFFQKNYKGRRKEDYPET
ncbi:MAG: MATE family efflux transporter [Clostridiales bacterium]|nr:MATE family efflux transporter [Clostridiales bacterium]